MTSTQPDDDDGDTFSLATESEYVDSTSVTPYNMVDDSPPRRAIFKLNENPVCPDDSEVSNMFRKAWIQGIGQG